jgi:hypothetical protein
MVGAGGGVSHRLREEGEMLHHHHYVEFRWVLLTALVALAVGIFLTMGYGLIGLAFLFVAGALIGGAMMSYLRTA